MTVPKVSDADFVRRFEEAGPSKLAKELGSPVASVYRRRTNLEAKFNRQITGPDHRNRTRSNIAHPHRIQVEVESGIVLVGSDAHIWPGELSPMFRAFAKFAKDMTPAVVVMNGDAFDGASISQHPPIGWATLPTVQEEIESCQEALSLIERAVPRKTRKIWSLGNHDARFETKIATVAPEFAKVEGTSLRDHFPMWEPCWGTWINDSVVIKHRFKGGIHAPHNNTMWSGKTMVTGHLHSAKVQPFSDYNGTRYGVDTGCLAEPYADAFRDYTEDNPRNWRSGFCVLTFKNGELLQPELVLSWGDNAVQFRGEIMKV